MSTDLRDRLNNLQRFSLWLFHVSACVHVSNDLRLKYLDGIRKTFSKACVHVSNYLREKHFYGIIKLFVKHVSACVHVSRLEFIKNLLSNID